MDLLVPSALSWWAGVGNDRLIADKYWTESRPKVYRANPFPHNRVLPEYYMRLLVPH